MHQLEENSIKQFTQWADNYDNPLTSITFQQTNSHIVKLLNPKPDSSLLDVGCGSGILIQKLLSLNRDIKLFGLDITPKMVEVAKRNLLIIQILKSYRARQLKCLMKMTRLIT